MPPSVIIEIAGVAGGNDAPSRRPVAVLYHSLPHRVAGPIRT